MRIVMYNNKLWKVTGERNNNYLLMLIENDDNDGILRLNTDEVDKVEKTATLLVELSKEDMLYVAMQWLEYLAGFPFCPERVNELQLALYDIAKYGL